MKLQTAVSVLLLLAVLFAGSASAAEWEPVTITDDLGVVVEITKYPERIDDLIDSYNLLIRKNPDFSRCYYELGHLYLKKNELLNAVNAFKYALDLEENNPFYLNSMAFAQVQLEQYDEAIRLYKKAITLNPDKEWLLGDRFYWPHPHTSPNLFHSTYGYTNLSGNLYKPVAQSSADISFYLKHTLPI